MGDFPFGNVILCVYRCTFHIFHVLSLPFNLRVRTYELSSVYRYVEVNYPLIIIGFCSSNEIACWWFAKMCEHKIHNREAAREKDHDSDGDREWKTTASACTHTPLSLDGNIVLISANLNMNILIIFISLSLFPLLFSLWCVAHFIGRSKRNGNEKQNRKLKEPCEIGWDNVDKSFHRNFIYMILHCDGLCVRAFIGPMVWREHTLCTVFISYAGYYLANRLAMICNEL